MAATSRGESSLADVTERLFTEFGASIRLTDIVDTVRRARADLAGSPELALPELIERLARQRLTQIITCLSTE